MPGHCHSKSKSHSVFSIDTLRVFSRAGSRQAFRNPLDQKENVRPLSPPPEPYYSNAKPQSTSEALVNDRKSYPSLANGRNTPSLARNFRNRRSRFSWFSLPGQAFSLNSSMGAFTQSDEILTMDQATISGPVLTSTTNHEVASATGIQHDILPPMVGNGRTDTYLRVSRHGNSADNGNDIQPSAFARFGALVKSRLRPRHKMHVISSHASQDKSDDISFLEQQVQRCHAETLNLCNSKAQNLTGNGNVKKKGLGSHKVGITDNVCKSSVRSSEESLLGHTPTHRFVDFTSGDWDTEQPSRSLSRSFHSALEKLDRMDDPPPANPGLLRSFASRTNLGRALGDKSKAIIPKVDQNSNKVCGRPDQGNHPVLVDGSGLLRDYVTDFSNVSAMSQVGQPSNAMPTPRTGADTAMTTDLAMKPNKKRNPGLTGIEQSDPLQLASTREGYIPSEAFCGYPKGVNPLRMHTDTMVIHTGQPKNSVSPKSYKEMFEYWRDLPVDVHGRPLQQQSLNDPQGPSAVEIARPFMLGPSTLTTLAQPRRNTGPHRSEQSKKRLSLVQEGRKPSMKQFKSDRAIVPTLEQERLHKSTT